MTSVARRVFHRDGAAPAPARGWLAALLLGAALAAVGGCGQRGPLYLPEPSAGAAAGGAPTTNGAAAEPADEEDERDER